MSTDEIKDKTRRQTVALGAGLSAAGLAGWSTLGDEESGPVEASAESDSGGKPGAQSAGARQPVVFLPHGGGPWPFVQMGFGTPGELARLTSYLQSLSQLPTTPPKALLIISAHWEEPQPTVMSGAAPPLLFDYHGFPPEAYQLTWPAPGEPRLAARVQDLLRAGGFDSRSNAERGFDHGTFVPLKLAYPNAELPTVQLSMKRGLDPVEHLAMGRALQPLRDEGVFILASGMSYHNMRGFGAGGREDSEQFDRWLRETAVLESKQRDERLTQWEKAPRARAVHPREDHLMPMMVAAGAAGTDRGQVGFADSLMGLRISGVHFI